MTDATAIPVNLFENERELILVAPMPGVAPEDISVDVTDDGQLTRARPPARRGPGAHQLPDARMVVRAVRADDRPALRRRRPARQRHLRQRRADDHVPEGGRDDAGRVLVSAPGTRAGMTAGHAGARGGDDDDPPRRRSSATTSA